MTSNRRLVNVLTLDGIRITDDVAVLILKSVHDEMGMTVEIESKDIELALWIHSTYHTGKREDVAQYPAALDDLMNATKATLATRFGTFKVEIEDYFLFGLYVDLDHTTYDWEELGLIRG